MPMNFANGVYGITSESEVNRLAAALQGTYGWNQQSGAVTFGSVLTFNVAAITAGDYVVNSVVGAAYAGGTVVLTTQDATNPRVDIIVITSAGAVSAIPGTPAALTSTSGPVPPTPSASQLEIARIWVPASGTSLDASSITDRRVAIPMGTLPEVWQPQVGNMIGTTDVGVANTAYGTFMAPVLRPMVITKLRFRIGVQSGNIDVGLYSWDGTTATRLASMGSTACPVAGLYNANIADTTVYPGIRYIVFFVADNATASIYRTDGISPTFAGLGVTKATSFVLPATMTSLSNANGTEPICAGLVSGGNVV